MSYCEKCKNETNGYATNILTGKQDSLCRECWDESQKGGGVVLLIYLILVIVAGFCAIIFIPN